MSSLWLRCWLRYAGRASAASDRACGVLGTPAEEEEQEEEAPGTSQQAVHGLGHLSDVADTCGEPVPDADAPTKRFEQLAAGRTAATANATKSTVAASRWGGILGAHAQDTAIRPALAAAGRVKRAGFHFLAQTGI